MRLYHRDDMKPFEVPDDKVLGNARKLSYPLQFRPGDDQGYGVEWGIGFSLPHGGFEIIYVVGPKAKPKRTVLLRGAKQSLTEHVVEDDFAGDDSTPYVLVDGELCPEEEVR